MRETWALLTYTIPREPTAPRVAIWRKLKKLGAVLLYDAVWIVPNRPTLLEQLRWLAIEINEAGGAAAVWAAQGDLAAQDELLIAQFVAQAESGYQHILRALDDPLVNRRQLAHRYQQIRASDYFHAPSGEVVRARLEGNTL